MAVAVTEKKEKFLQQFRVDEGVSGVSKAAELALENINFPTTREEYWKYTRLAKIQNGEFNLVEFEGELQVESVNEDALHIECVNGFFRKPEGEIPNGVVIDELSDIDHSMVDDQTQFFAALNTAYYTSAIKIKVEAGTQVEKSIQLNFTQSESAVQAQPRIQIEVADGANVNFILNWHSNGRENCFWNGVSEISVGRNAQVQVHQLQRGGDENYLINTTRVRQERDSRFSIYTISLEGKICRNNLNIDVDGENCETRLNGVYLPHGKQHIDNHTYVDHKVPNCFSSENYKGVLDDQSTAVFNGKVMVRQDAQKINAFQNNQNILLSDDATINSKPELEIYADDVKCSHGSTTGQLDSEALFYLQSRGVSANSARKMLIKAFVIDALEEIELDSFRNYVEELVELKFSV